VFAGSTGSPNRSYPATGAQSKSTHERMQRNPSASLLTTEEEVSSTRPSSTMSALRK